MKSKQDVFFWTFIIIRNSNMPYVVPPVKITPPTTNPVPSLDYDNDNDNILFDHNIQIYTTDLQ